MEDISMKLEEANQILNDAGYLMEDNQPQMNRKNLRKWLTSKFGIKFAMIDGKYQVESGTYQDVYVVRVPESPNRPIQAIKIEKYTKPISSNDILDMMIDSSNKVIGGAQYEITLVDISDLSKQEMAKYFSDLFDKDSDFWEIKRIK